VHSSSTLVFVEVKTRRSRNFDAPWENLHAHKRQQVRRLAAAFLSEVQQRPHSLELRFDAIGILLDGRGKLICLDHIENAF
jgi:putative endonuclease